MRILCGVTAILTVMAVACGGKDGGDAGVSPTDPDDGDVAAFEVGQETSGEEAAGEAAAEGTLDAGPEAFAADPAAEAATEAATEVDCTPSCGDRVCGDDGCGGQCGLCDGGKECHNGKCTVPCAKSGFVPEVTKTSWKPVYPEGSDKYDHGAFAHYESDSEKYPFSTLRLEVRQYNPWEGPLGPGTYPVGTTSYQDCDICVTLSDTCGPQGCVKTLIATEGQIEIKQLSGGDGPFEAVLHDVVLSEASITADNTKIVTGGKRWCLDDYEMKAETVELLVPEPQCVKEGTGTLQNKNIQDFSLTNCVGHPVPLHSLCGEVKAVWMVLVANWCPACKEWTPIVLDATEKFGDKVALWFVVGEDVNGAAPDEADCKYFADMFGLDYERVFFDPGYEKVTKYIYPYGFQGIPYNIILDGDNMSYVWSNGLDGEPGSLIWYLVDN